MFPEFSNIWETAYDVTDPAFDCNVNRTHATDTSTQMYLINHFLDKLLLGQPVPYVEKANVTNAATGAGSLGTQVATCVAAYGRPPNFMLVDVSDGLHDFTTRILTRFAVLRIRRWLCFSSRSFDKRRHVQSHHSCSHTCSSY
jgi:hypothetical protein